MPIWSNISEMRVEATVKSWRVTRSGAELAILITSSVGRRSSLPIVAADVNKKVVILREIEVDGDARVGDETMKGEDNRSQWGLRMVFKRL
jgi:hypothetical protein